MNTGGQHIQGLAALTPMFKGFKDNETTIAYRDVATCRDRADVLALVDRSLKSSAGTG